MQNLNTPATADCFLTTGPCGGRPMQAPEVILLRDTNFTFTWQKNENHWTTANPGTFNLSYAETDTGMFTNFYSFVDTNTASLTLYSAVVPVNTIPFKKQGVIQLAYVSPSLPATFYQCVDVIVA